MRNRLYAAILALTVLALLGALLPVSSSSAQGGSNLLNNPGFEGPYNSYNVGDTNGDGIPEIVWEFRIASGWSPWWREQAAGDAGWANRRPEYRPASYSYNSTAAQQYFTSFGTHQAGLWQQAVGIAPGETYRLTLAVYLWSSSGSNLFRSENPGGLRARVGLDPAGGVNPYAPGVVWSDWYTTYDTWTVLSVEAVSQAEAITAFVWSEADFPVEHNDVAIDEAVLVSLGAAEAAEPAPAADSTPAAADSAPAAAAAADAAAVDTAPAAATAPTLSSGWNLRLRVRPAAAAVDAIPAGTVVPVLGRSADRNWVYVEFNGQRGWVASWLAQFSVPFDDLPVAP